MTRKDYELLAGAVRGMPAEVREHAAPRLADVLAGDNARFDRAVWLAACDLASKGAR